MPSRQHHAIAIALAVAFSLMPGWSGLSPALAETGLSVLPLPVEPSDGRIYNGSEATLSFEDSWHEIAPPARGEHVAVLDEKHDRLVMFGGRTNSSALHDDVWVLSPRRSPRWERVEPLGDGPSPRTGAAAVYDPARERMLLIGGSDSTGPLDDVWQLSLKGRFQWRRLQPSGSSPGGRSHHSATLDPENDRILVFGGEKALYNPCDAEVWQLTLEPRLAWTRLPIPGSRPSVRSYHSAVYAPDLHALVVLGGLDLRWLNWSMDLHDSTDVWLLSTRGSPVWTDLTPRISGAPSCGLYGHVAVYDPALTRMLVFGGSEWSSWQKPCGARPSTWSLSLKDLAWSVVPSGADEPRGRVCAAAVLDAAAGRVLLHGGETYLFDLGTGSFSDTWSLSLDRSPTWSRVLPDIAPPSPSRWSGQSAIADPVRDRVLLFQDGVLWSRSFREGEGWTRSVTVGDPPPADPGHVVVYDAKRDRMIVQGGRIGPRVDEPNTWALTLAPPMTWSRLAVRGDAPLRSDAAAIYDPVRDRLVIFGGDSLYYQRGDVWALSLGEDREWTRLAPDAGWELRRLAASAIYDPRHDRMIVFGGGVPDADSWDVHNDVWEFSLGDPGWKQLTRDSRSPDTPEMRAFQAAVYDEVADRMIVAGGYCPGPFQRGPWKDSWALDLSTNAWTRLSPSGGPPPLWMVSLGVRDPRRHRTVVMEGDCFWALETGPGRDGGRAAGPSRSDAERAISANVGFSLHVRPNPTRGEGLSVVFTLPNAAPARLELLDVSGRRVVEREVGSFGAGRHALDLGESQRLAPGLYLVCLRQGANTRVMRAVVLR
jgi:hypothetical protein